MPWVVALANQKGGVAKTTTTHALGVALAQAGHRVLLVDLDPQACLTFSAGVDPDQLELSLHDLLIGRRSDPTEVIVTLDGLDLLPSTIDLAGSEMHLMTRTGREFALARALKPVLPAYDAVLIDCPPSLGLLTINGLTAAQEILVPMQCETLSRRGVKQLLETVDDVRSYTNAELRIRGVIATMYDGRTRLTQDVLADLGDDEALTVLEPPVPKSVRVAEAPGHGRSVITHAPRSGPAAAYRELAATLLPAPKAKTRKAG